jgi:hypothetical protein
VLNNIPHMLTEDGDISVPAWLPSNKDGFKTYYEPENFNAHYQHFFDHRDDADVLGIKKTNKR